MEGKKILVRLPNWLGDMVMSVGALHQLPHVFPGAEISVIVKKGLQDLLPFFPPVKQVFVFSKEEHKGMKGLWRFGRSIRQTERFDLFISFPDSFSSALMGYATGAPARIGYKKEGREILLTNSFAKQKGLHRAEEYALLPALYSKKEMGEVSVSLQHHFPKRDYIVININSEASSRRLTVAKAVEMIASTRIFFPNKIVLIGGPKEKEFVETVLQKTDNKAGIESLAGKTSLAGLVHTLASATLVLTTDSGPAHLANALGTQTVVLFGAGNENNTSPYNRAAAQVIRLGKLSCEPCTRNACIQFGTPQCLELLDTNFIMQAMKKRIEYAG
jgi:heptosyltransferase II